MKILLNKDVIVYEEDDELILVNMLKNNFYALDYMATVIWKKLQELGGVSEVIDYICKEFNVEKEVCKNDIVEFIYNLEKVGIIEIDE